MPSSALGAVAVVYWTQRTTNFVLDILAETLSLNITHNFPSGENGNSSLNEKYLNKKSWYLMSAHTKCLGRTSIQSPQIKDNLHVYALVMWSSVNTMWVKSGNFYCRFNCLRPNLIKIWGNDIATKHREDCDNLLFASDRKLHPFGIIINFLREDCASSLSFNSFRSTNESIW